MKSRANNATAGQPPPYRTRYCGLCGDGKLVVNGEWLRWMRVRAGLSMRAVASECGLSVPFISNVEHNRRLCPSNLEMVYVCLPKLEAWMDEEK